MAIARGPDGVIRAVNGDSLYSRVPGATAWIGRPFRDASGNRPGQDAHNCRGIAALVGRLFARFDNRLYQANPADSIGDTLRFRKLSESDVFGLSPTGASLGLANLADGLYLLDFSGQTRLLTGQPLLGWLGPGQDGVLALARDGRRVYRSLDQGFTWVIASPALPDSAQSVAEAQGVLAVTIAKTSEVWISANGGAWARAESGLIESEVTPLGVANGEVWARTYAGLGHAPVAGGQWTVEATSPGGFGADAIVDAAGTLWAGQTNGGLWARSGIPAEWSLVSRDRVSLIAASEGRIAAAVDQEFDGLSYLRILKVCDGAGNCRETGRNVLGRSLHLGTGYSSISGLAVRGDTLLASDSLLYRSRDGGTTWDTACNLHTSSPTQLAFAAGALYVFRYGYDCAACLERSEDLGTSWTPVQPPVNRAGIFRIRSDGRRLVLLTAQAIIATEDGIHWENEPFMPGFSPIDMAAGEGYVAVGGKDGRLMKMDLTGTVDDIRARPTHAPAMRGRPFGARMFPDRAGHPRLANGASPP